MENEFDNLIQGCTQVVSTKTKKIYKIYINTYLDKIFNQRIIILVILLYIIEKVFSN